MKFAMRLLVAASVMVVLTDAASAADWGDVKGQVVFTGPAMPAAKRIKVDKDQQVCLAKGAIVSDELVIDAKTKGVKNVMIWLAPTESGTKLAIHPSLAAVPKEKVVIDQPCCMFVPRITMMREGQILEVKNPAPVLHNAKIMGSATVNGTFNLAIPGGQSIEKKPRAEKKPMLLACDVHGWMGGRIGVFDHPYFALTKEDGTFEIKNAPAGKVKIFVMQEKVGWLHKMTGEKLSDGQEITIKAGANDLGKIAMPKAE